MIQRLTAGKQGPWPLTPAAGKNLWDDNPQVFVKPYDNNGDGVDPANRI